MSTRIVGSLKQIGLRISTLTRASTIREIVMIWWAKVSSAEKFHDPEVLSPHPQDADVQELQSGMVPSTVVAASSAFEPVPSLLEPSTSHASSYPCKRHGSNPSLGSFSTHEDDFEDLVASSLYGGGTSILF